MDRDLLKEALGLVEQILATAIQVGGDDDAFSLPALSGQSTGKHGTFLLPQDITTQIIGARVTAALHKRVGRRRTYGVEDLASYLGVSSKTVEKYMAGETPNTVNLWRLMAFFGSEFATEIFAPLGMTVVESDSAHATQCLSIEGLLTMLPQLRALLGSLEGSLHNDGGEQDA